jgi:hypothetical protein
LAAASHRQVLSDDLNALLPAAGKVFVHKIPFAGDLGQTAELADPVPLAALCRLEKGPEIRLQALGRGVALAALLACSPCVNANPYWVDRAADNLAAIARAVPVSQLSFFTDSLFDRILAAIESRDAHQ